jgi:hypothetical protein
MGTDWKQEAHALCCARNTTYTWRIKMLEFLAYILARVIAGVITAVILAALFQHCTKVVGTASAAV